LTMRCLILGGKCMLQGCGERRRRNELGMARYP
jgi:hypothetical protein